jgi:broad specificity phosphatase PhoE
MAEYLYLARHGSTGPEWLGRFLGAKDVELDDAGRRQARSLASRLRSRGPISRCISSPLRRAVQTAEAIRGEAPIEIDRDLREVDFGRWEGRTFEQIRRSDPELVNRWAALAPDFAFPGGESLQSFLGRVHAAADHLAESDAEGVLSVSHGGVIRAMLCYLLGLDARAYVAFDVAPGSLAVVRLFERKGALAELIRAREAEAQ